MSCFVLGYGSLLNLVSRERTIGVTESFPVVVKGFRRVWGVPTSYWMPLGVLADPTSSIHAVCAEVHSKDWKALDAREGGYDRIAVHPANIARYNESESTVNPKHHYFIYVARPETVRTPSTTCPVLLSYVDCCVEGALQLGGPRFAEKFFRETHQWGTVLIDRECDVYRSQNKFRQETYDFTDSMLAALNISLRCFSKSYVIAYGSLMNPQSQQVTLDDVSSAERIPVVVKGWQRCWGISAGGKWSPLTVLPVQNFSETNINGTNSDELVALCIGINSWTDLDRRERGYKRIEVSPTRVLNAYTREPLTFDRQSSAEKRTFSIYFMPPSTPSPEAPILLSYVDVVVEGCLNMGRTAVENLFMSKGLNWACVCDDRNSPRFRRVATEGTVSREDQRHVDEWLRFIKVMPNNIIYQQRTFVILYGTCMFQLDDSAVVFHQKLPIFVRKRKVQWVAGLPTYVPNDTTDLVTTDLPAILVSVPMEWRCSNTEVGEFIDAEELRLVVPNGTSRQVVGEDECTTTPLPELCPSPQCPREYILLHHHHHYKPEVGLLPQDDDPHQQVSRNSMMLDRVKRILEEVGGRQFAETVRFLN
eukprot:PhF_6_TR6940/c0_g1_i2/m.10181